MTSSVRRPVLAPLLAVLAFALVLSMVQATPADAAVQRVKPRFFGMTDTDPLSWPRQPVGSLRLWDSGVTWREIETSPGTFNWTTLDAIVREARAHRAKPLLVLGMTPQFHANRPNVPGVYGLGSPSMPKLWTWKRYVRKVAKRYGARLDYQVWNEANVSDFWRGSPRQMAKLTQTSSKVLAKHAPKATLAAPALATRLTGQRKWLRTFYAQRVARRPVARWVDVVSLNLYPLPSGKPEDSITLLRASRTMLGWAGVYKPIWNTEVNYGLQTGGGGSARQISNKKEAAFVARTYILNAAADVKRVYWYSWQIRDLANTQLTRADGTTLTPAGIAYGQARSWMVRASMKGCSRDARGTYTCTLRTFNGVKRIYWNPSRGATVRAVPSAIEKKNLKGHTERLFGGETIRVWGSPIMVRSKR